jgi:hypothetical protein
LLRIQVSDARQQMMPNASDREIERSAQVDTFEICQRHDLDLFPIDMNSIIDLSGKRGLNVGPSEFPWPRSATA